MTEKSIITYIEQDNKYKVCASTYKGNVQLLAFHDELSKINSKYTLSYLYSVENKTNRHNKNNALEFKISKCIHEIVFAKHALSGFIVCEVYPKGSRIFTQSQAYLFLMKKGIPSFLSKKIISYN